MYAYDLNGCESDAIGPYEIINIAKIRIEPNTGETSDDACSLSRGSITKVKVSDGIPSSYQFEWVNAKTGEIVQRTQDLINVGAGTYKLIARDMTDCYAISEEYTIEDKPFKIPPPIANNIKICYASELTIPVVAPNEGIYQLFANLEDELPILESKTGIFKLKVAKTADYYIRRKLGSCVSEFTKIQVQVIFDNIEITNIMTPNGDGLNDFWMVRGLPANNNTNIKIYTRSGQLVYESTGNYTKPFDGRFRGAELPAGVYYYVIDLRSECKALGGSLTLLR